MDEPAESQILHVTIRRTADDVYDYVATIENFPRWSAFARTVTKDGAMWIFTTPAGEVRVDFAPRNPLRILDHTVTLADGQTVCVPMRVVPNGPGASDVQFTVFRRPEMSDSEFEADATLVLADLLSLKQVIEQSRP